MFHKVTLLTTLVTASIFMACDDGGPSGPGFTDDEGPSKCDPEDPQMVSGTWALNAGETSLTTTKTNDLSFDRTIVELTTTKLELSDTSVWPDSVSHTIALTWTSQ